MTAEETHGFGPKEHEGFLAPPAAPPRRSRMSRSWSAVCLATVCSAAAFSFFFLFSQSVLRGGASLAASPMHSSSPAASSPWPQPDGKPGASSSSSGGWSWGAVNVSRTLRWQPCDDDAYDCARLDVPMDWQDPSEDRRVVLAVIRLRATDTADYRGPVFFNPGGPGGSGVHAMRDRGALLHEIVGKNHDLITWDPRGIGASVPRVDCWGGSAARAQAWALQDPGVLGAHAGVLGAAYARATAYAQTCERAMAGSGLLEHVGTAAHARDLLALVEETRGPGGGLRYWGFSYGTLLGGTFAAMYPDRVERLVSDGNVDYRAWFEPRNLGFLQDADRVLGAFAWFCHDAGPAGCPFAAPTREGIHDRLERLLERLRETPVVVVPAVCGDSDGGCTAELPRLVTWSDVKRLVSAALYQPVLLFPRLAEVLAALEQGDGRPFYDLMAQGPDGAAAKTPPLCDADALLPPSMPRVGEDTEDAFPAIMCADMPRINDTVEEFGRFAQELLNVSHDAGAVNTLFRMACIGRTVRPKWRYDGPFEGNTSFPILFVNNVVDNVTPAASARKNAAGFPSSRILSQNSYGHTSLAAASTCTSEYIHAYFQNGSLPANGTTCMPESYPFQEVQALAGNRISVVTHQLAKMRRRTGQWL